MNIYVSTSRSRYRLYIVSLQSQRTAKPNMFIFLSFEVGEALREHLNAGKDPACQRMAPTPVQGLSFKDDGFHDDADSGLENIL